MDKNYIRFGTLNRPFEDGRANDITFCVTEECNLRCKYCYLVHKNKYKKMSFQTAKKAVDYLLSAQYIYNESSVVWNFIGGEPFLEMDLIDKISDYIKQQMYFKKHPWFDNYMFNFSTNGILYHTKSVQDYIKKNSKHVSIGISVDGNKIKHDMQRIYPDGHGSYDDVAKNIPLWLSQFPNASTKATFSHDDLPHLKDSIIHLWNIGIKEIAANIVFEDVWDENDPIVFEDQLKSLADYIIDNKIFYDPDYTVRFFDPSIGLPMSQSMKQNRFCGSGKMIAVDCDGNFFPCIRFTDFALEKKKGFKIGNIQIGIIKDRVKPFQLLSIERMNDDECNNCDLASGCTSCVGFCYDDSPSGSIFKRTKYNCEMHKANVRAIEYFWNNINKKLNTSPNPREVKRREHEKSFNRYLAIYTNDQAVPHCCYSNIKDNSTSSRMSEKIMDKCLEFAKAYRMTPIFVGSTPEKYKEYTKIVGIDDFYGSDNEILVIDNSIPAILHNKDKKAHVIIILISRQNIPNIYDICVQSLYRYNAKRLNIILQEVKDFCDDDVKEYEKQLKRLSKYILECNPKVNLNVLNGTCTSVNRVIGCGCGTNTFTVAPNGYLYVCPGFYFLDENRSIGDLENGFTFDYAQEFDVQKSVDCGNCKNYACKRCVYLNKLTTNEYTVPPDIQCKLSNIENKLSLELLKALDIKYESEKEGMLKI